MAGEIWKDISCFEGVYQISTHGRIRRFYTNVGIGYKILNPWIGRKTGYRRVDLCFNGTKRKKVHQLVLETFVGPRRHKLEGRHLDGNRQNNRLDNLRWGTRSENQQDRAIHGTTSRGKANTKLTLAQVTDIRQLLISSKYTQQTIADMFGVSRGTITDINIGRNWKGKPNG